MINSASNNKDVKHHGILQVGNKLQLQDNLKHEPYQNTIHTRQETLKDHSVLTPLFQHIIFLYQQTVGNSRSQPHNLTTSTIKKVHYKQLDC